MNAARDMDLLASAGNLTDVSLPRNSANPLVPNPPPALHTDNSILMKAPREEIFETASDLSRWPDILPHYRYIHYYEKSPERNIVKMAALRSGIPIAWTSEQIIDRTRFEVRFHHLKAFTKGMHVVWTFEETPDGVKVSILHDLAFRIPALAPLADPIIGGFFISHVAGLTLACMKRHLESPRP
jgi:ribosome-associated toxin RatA of RatAB toxin-antitoxin module